MRFVAKALVFVFAMPVIVGLPSVFGEQYRNAGSLVPRDQPVGWFHGRAPVINPPSFNLQMHYGDGMNPYQFALSNPIVNRDPTGSATGAALGAAFSKWYPSPMDLLIFGSYFGGLSWANAWGGFGPPNIRDRLGLAWDRFGFIPTTNPAFWAWWGASNFVPSTTRLLATYGDLSILPRVFQNAIRGVNELKRSFDSVLIGLGGVAIGGAAAYAGVLDAVMWTVDEEW
jgi:hypothetical protein